MVVPQWIFHSDGPALEKDHCELQNRLRGFKKKTSQRSRDRLYRFLKTAEDRGLPSGSVTGTSVRGGHLEVLGKKPTDRKVEYWLIGERRVSWE